MWLFIKSENLPEVAHALKMIAKKRSAHFNKINGLGA
jgi:hypothetical protein